MYFETPELSSIRSAPLRIAPHRNEVAMIPKGSLRASKEMPMLSHPYPLEKEQRQAAAGRHPQHLNRTGQAG